MTHQAYWPGTSIPKSHGNAFDLSACPGCWPGSST